MTFILSLIYITSRLDVIAIIVFLSHSTYRHPPGLGVIIAYWLILERERGVEPLMSRTVINPP